MVNNAADGRQAVRSAKAEGYEFIKIYSALNTETYHAIIDEAGKLGMKTVGHIPRVFRHTSNNAFVRHFGMVAHAEELSKYATEFTDEEAKQFAALLKKNETWLSPTLIAMKWILNQTKGLQDLRNLPTLKYVHPLLQSKWLTANSYNRNSSPERIAQFEKMVAFHNRIVQECKAAGVPIVAGTDAGVSGVVGGFALHEELELVVEAGLTPEEMLHSATRLPAEWLNIRSEVGTIEEGKRADLLLLDANPLDDIRNTRKIAGVCVDGVWISRARIDNMLLDLARRNNAAKPKFDWKKLTGK